MLSATSTLISFDYYYYDNLETLIDNDFDKLHVTYVMTRRKCALSIIVSRNNDERCAQSMSRRM